MKLKLFLVALASVIIYGAIKNSATTPPPVARLPIPAYEHILALLN